MKIKTTELDAQSLVAFLHLFHKQLACDAINNLFVYKTKAR